MKEQQAIPGYVYYAGYTRAMAKLSVGSGWAGLIDEVFDEFEDMSSGSAPSILIPRIIQVKEKMGGLRIYTDRTESDEMFDFLYEIQNRSFDICEKCGQSGALRRDGGIYFTACDEHANGLPTIKPF